jgi:UDP-glucose 4-epimerase
MKRALVTGGAGFIGSAAARRLVSDGIEVVVYDDLSSGHREFVEELIGGSSGSFVEGDVLDADLLRTAMEGCDAVFHIAANADVRHGLEHPERDLEQNTIATSVVLETMRAAGVSTIAFTSSASVYGEPDIYPTPEHCPFPDQTSLYGASKVGAEGMIQAYSHGFGFTSVIIRPVSVLGEGYTHGHVYDFYRSLQGDPDHLKVLGNGKQRRSYLYVGDCVDGILCAVRAAKEGEAAVYNIGTDESVTVDESIAIITRRMGVRPEIEYAGGERGWPGDPPLMMLDCTKLRNLGWAPKFTIEQSVTRTVDWLARNPFVFEKRVTRHDGVAGGGARSGRSPQRGSSTPGR